MIQALLRQSNLLMAILNVTPDSFSDGGDNGRPDLALQRVNELVAAGAHIVDVGAESTRPGSETVSVTEELRRLEPIFQAVKTGRWSKLVVFSIDTQKPEVMERAVAHGFLLVNNVAGLAPIEMLRFLAQRHVTYLASHMYGEPKNMQQSPLDAKTVRPIVQEFFERSHQVLRDAGFTAERIWLDPGIGFGKDLGANLAALQLALSLTRQFHVAIGLSRKAFIGRLLNLPDPKDRDPGSKMLELGVMLAGVKAIRTHDVALLSSIRQYLST